MGLAKVASDPAPLVSEPPPDDRSGGHGSSVDPKSNLSAEKLEVKAAELRVRRLEAEKALSTANAPWWKRANPLVLAILAATVSLIGNMVIAVINNNASVKQEQIKAKDDLDLEREKARYNLVLQAMATNDTRIAKGNIHFFIDAGLLLDPNGKIRSAIDQDKPVLPSPSGVAPRLPPGVHSAPEIATAYNFPAGLYGEGQTIGVVECGGGYSSKDLSDYFSKLNEPTPDVISIGVDGSENRPTGIENGADIEVAADIEIVGALAPRAHIRVYFAPSSLKGIKDAIKAAINDNVSVLSITWGFPESPATQGIGELNAVLAAAAKRHITVLSTPGDSGSTSFPASSPWVLAVGGTSLKVKAGYIDSETPWMFQNESSGKRVVSQIFPMPSWQYAEIVGSTHGTLHNRAVPDVVASADPTFGVGVRVGGQVQVLGGGSTAVMVWAGLITLINESLGHNIGFFNPQLYREIGPAGVLRKVSQSTSELDGPKAAAHWAPLVGWGSPDGLKLLRWFKAHPSQ